MRWGCRCRAQRAVQHVTRCYVTRLTLGQLATTQEGREICAGLKRAAQVQQQAAVAMGSLHGVVQQVRAAPARSIGHRYRRSLGCACDARHVSHSLALQLMERAKMPTQGRPARSIDLVNL